MNTNDYTIRLEKKETKASGTDFLNEIIRASGRIVNRRGAGA